MADDPKALARRMYNEVISNGDFDVLDELIHDDFVEHEELPGLPTDKEAPRAFFTMFRAAFPDLNASIEDMIQEGDKLVVRSRMSGTHKGEFMGIPPTNNKFDVQAIDEVEFRDGKAIAHWGVFDSAAMMEQLGVMPGPEAG